MSCLHQACYIRGNGLLDVAGRLAGKPLCRFIPWPPFFFSLACLNIYIYRYIYIERDTYIYTYIDICVAIVQWFVSSFGLRPGPPIPVPPLSPLFAISRTGICVRLIYSLVCGMCIV